MKQKNIPSTFPLSRNGSLLTEKYLREWNDPRMGIRAAWYVNWDKQSLLSLKRNISHINLLMGECCSSI